MSNRAATILAVAAVISSFCIYATFAQDAPRAPDPEERAIVVGPRRLRLEWEQHSVTRFWNKSKRPDTMECVLCSVPSRFLLESRFRAA